MLNFTGLHTIDAELFVAHTIKWYDQEKTIIVVTFEPGWTWREFIVETAAPKIAMMDSIDHAVYIIHLIPPGRISLPQMGWLRSYTEEAGTPHHPNYAAAVFVTTNRIATTLVNVAVKILPKWEGRLLIRPTEEAAFILVQELKAKKAKEAVATQHVTRPNVESSMPS